MNRTKTIYYTVLALLTLLILSLFAHAQYTPANPIFMVGTQFKSFTHVFWGFNNAYYVNDGQTGEVVYSGSSEQAVLEAALNVSNRHVYVATGDYTLDSAVNVSWAENITLSGDGYSSVLRANASGTDNVLTFILSQNVLVKDLWIVGNGAGSFAGDTQDTRNGIGIFGCNNVTVSNVIVSDCYREAIYIRDRVYLAWSQWTNNSLITDCNMLNSQSGVRLFGGLNHIITDSFVSDCYNGFIGGTFTDGTFSNNVIFRSDEHGIYFANITSVVIDGNAISECLEMGIQLNCGGAGEQNRAVTLSDNTIRSCGYTGLGGGINIGSTGTVEYLSISNNMISNCGGNSLHGIYIYGTGTYISVIGNHVYNNTSPGTVMGIYLGASITNAVVSHNVVNGVSADKIRVDGSGDVHHNIGFVTENTGTETFTGLGTAFNHGLDSNADLFLCSFNSSLITGYSWTSSATQITLTVTPTGDYTVYWYAFYVYP